MLEQLIESTNQPNQDRRREGFFLTSLTLVFTVVAIALIYSLFSQNLVMANESLDLSQLVAPVVPPAEKPAPPPEQSAAAPKPENAVKAIDRLPVRAVNMQSVEESPVSVPTDISNTRAAHRSRPAGKFEFGKDDDEGSSSGIRTDSRGNVGSIGLSQSGNSSGDHSGDGETAAPPPPPVIKKEELTPPEKPKNIITSGGVVNGKATKLVKPVYPQPAKLVHASGAVNVQVLIDEEGNVISANAVTGHPLLRQTAEQAARASKFSPTYLSTQKVKVTGVIVYNFVRQ